MRTAVHVAPDLARTAALGLAWASTAMFGLAAVLLVAGAGAGAWAPAAAAAIVLKAAFFNAWLTLGVAIDVVVLAAVVTTWPPSLS